MSYNNGSFSLFNQTGFTISSAIYAESIIPSFEPGDSAKFVNVTGSSVQPTVRSTGATSVTNAYGLNLSLSISASNMSILNAYGLSITAPTILSGTCSFLYGLYVTKPTASGAGTASNPYTAFIQGMVGIGTSIPMNELDIRTSALNSGLAVGTYAGVVTVPQNSVLVSGAMGVGTPTPVYPLDVQGGVEAFQVLAPETTFNQQMGRLATGYNQGGFGSGAVGSNLRMNTLSAQTFNLFTVNTACGGFSGGAFDGRYVYFLPSLNTTLTRYDITQPFNSSTSYQFFTSSVFSNNSGLGNGQFDGRYVYYCSQTITRYDTTLPFTMTTSYASFNTLSVNSIASRYQGGCFDETYVYFAPGITAGGTPSGLLLRYNTALPFTSTTSYQLFNVATNINTNLAGFGSAAFDGRYVYYAPYLNATDSGFLLRYDTSKAFTSASSYESFDMETKLNSELTSFIAVIFDGKLLNWIPHDNGTNWVSYDPDYPFTNSLSYSVFDLTSLVGSKVVYAGGGFDGRFIYMAPNTIGLTYSGHATVYDTTVPFDMTASYQVVDMTKVQSLCWGFRGLTSDGQYVYFIPSGVRAAGTLNNPQGQLLRIPCYTGQPTTSLAIGYSTGITASGNISFLMPTATTATAGTAGVSPSRSSGFLQVFLNGNLQYIPFY